MPTYQYACTQCAHTFEQFQSFSDDALSVCPQCSGRLRKVFNAVGVVFKGSGFYRTDSRTTKDDSAPAADKGAEKGTGDKAGSGDKGSDKGAGTTSESSGEKSTPAKASDTSSSSSSPTSGSTSAA